MSKSNLHFELNGFGKLVPAVVCGETVAQFPQVGDFIHLYVDTTANTLYRWNGVEYVAVGGSSSGTFTRAGGTDYEVGGIAAGTILEGKTIEQILSMMLYRTDYPTLVDPSVRVVLDKAYFAANSPATVTGTVYFDRGAITPAYSTNGYRSGLPNTYSCGEKVISSNSLSCPFSVEYDNIDEEQMLFVWVAYDKGEQPKDSLGNNYDTFLQAGKVSAYATIYGIGNMYQKLGGDDWTIVSVDQCTTEDGKGFEFSLGGEISDAAKQMVAIDAAVEIIGVQQFDEFRNIWAWIYDTPEESLEAFTITTDQIEGKYVKIYTNALTQIGARKLRFYTTNPEEE